MVGLPAPEGFRAFAGLAYIPPVTIQEVNTHYGAVEAGFAYVLARSRWSSAATPSTCSRRAP